MKRAELVFIPSPGAGHLFSMVEIAKLLVERDDRLSITIFVMKLPFESPSSSESLSDSTTNRINFIHLTNNSLPETTRRSFFTTFIESHKPHVKEAVANLTNTLTLSASPTPKLAGFVLDMFCTTMIDIANEFGVPSYVFYTSGAAFLGLMLHAQALYDEQNKSMTEFKDSDSELPIPSLVNPLPAKCLPSVFLERDWLSVLCEQARRIRSVKGVMVNSFQELESPAMGFFSDEKRKNRIKTVYPVGPILNLKSGNNNDSNGSGGAGSTTKSEIIEWLDDQPESSVVFLCFGSMGTFGEDQVKEIARALEEGGHRFLWSLRQPPPKDQFAVPSDYANPRDALPEGFLERTAGIGKIIGWAPQVSVLAHKSIGGFVSHCGWNSTLESIWFGVPIATWPLYAEQQFNAFQLVVELGLGVEIKMEYRKVFEGENQVIVSAEEIDRGIRKLMENDGEIKKRMKEMSEKSRRASMVGGSSFSSLGCFIDDVIDNMP